jgi:tryptophanyl-tRNA synthetase
MTTRRKRILSGIKPTGDVHLGGYLGAMRQWPQFQADDSEVFYFIADLHALNQRPSASEMRDRSLDLVAWLLALGIDPERNHIYVQSQVPQHSELSWIFNNFATMGELSRMTQYKDKAQKTGVEGQIVALFNYPVLMAADILLYDADLIPVGDDQTQHVELTRDIAKRFNGIYGDVFRLPDFVNPTVSARVMMLDDPKSKMSKSEGGDGCVYMLDDEALIRRKFARAVTDSHATIRYDKREQPGVANLIEIAAAIQGALPADIVAELSSKGYGELKNFVADTVIGEVLPLQEAFRTYRADESHLKQVIEQGRAAVSDVAEAKLREVKTILGLL